MESYIPDWCSKPMACNGACEVMGVLVGGAVNICKDRLIGDGNCLGESKHNDPSDTNENDAIKKYDAINYGDDVVENNNAMVNENDIILNNLSKEYDEMAKDGATQPKEEDTLSIEDSTVSEYLSVAEDLSRTEDLIVDDDSVLVDGCGDMVHATESQQGLQEVLSEAVLGSAESTDCDGSVMKQKTEGCDDTDEIGCVTQCTGQGIRELQEKILVRKKKNLQKNGWKTKKADQASPGAGTPKERGKSPRILKPTRLAPFESLTLEGKWQVSTDGTQITAMPLNMNAVVRTSNPLNLRGKQRTSSESSNKLRKAASNPINRKSTPSPLPRVASGPPVGIGPTKPGEVKSFGVGAGFSKWSSPISVRSKSHKKDIPDTTYKSKPILTDGSKSIYALSSKTLSRAKVKSPSCSLHGKKKDPSPGNIQALHSSKSQVPSEPNGITSYQVPRNSPTNENAMSSDQVTFEQTVSETCHTRSTNDDSAIIKSSPVDKHGDITNFQVPTKECMATYNQTPVNIVTTSQIVTNTSCVTACNPLPTAGNVINGLDVEHCCEAPTEESLLNTKTSNQSTTETSFEVHEKENGLQSVEESIDEYILASDNIACDVNAEKTVMVYPVAFGEQSAPIADDSEAVNPSSQPTEEFIVASEQIPPTGKTEIPCQVPTKENVTTAVEIPPNFSVTRLSPVPTEINSTAISVVENDISIETSNSIKCYSSTLSCVLPKTDHKQPVPILRKANSTTSTGVQLKVKFITPSSSEEKQEPSSVSAPSNFVTHSPQNINIADASPPILRCTSSNSPKCDYATSTPPNVHLATYSPENVKFTSSSPPNAKFETGCHNQSKHGILLSSSDIEQYLTDSPTSSVESHKPSCNLPDSAAETGYIDSPRSDHKISSSLIPEKDETNSDNISSKLLLGSSNNVETTQDTTSATEKESKNNLIGRFSGLYEMITPGLRDGLGHLSHRLAQSFSGSSIDPLSEASETPSTF